MKKFVMTTALALGLFLTGSVSANAQQSQIDALLAQIAALQGGTTVSAGTTFVYQGGLLKNGSRGQQVRDLQTCLAVLGNNPNSNIDGIFGPITAAAVRSFQASAGVQVDGIVGPVTGPLYTSACAATVVVVDTDTDGDDDDVDGNDNDDADEDEFPTTGGEEASLEEFDLQDGDDDDVEEGEMAEIAEIEFDVEDGDVMIQRIDLSFFAAAGNEEDEPWDVFETITLMVDGDEIAEEDVDDEDDWLENDDEPYMFRFNGLRYIVDEDDTAKITVAITAQSGVDGADNDAATWTLFVDDEGIRGIDTAGIEQYIGNGDDDTDENDEDTVTFDIEEEGEDDELDVRRSSNDPDSTTFKVEDDGTSDWFNIFTFELEADEDGADVEIEKLPVIIRTTDYAVTKVVNDLELEVDGDTLDDFRYLDVDEDGIDNNGNGVIDETGEVEEDTETTNSAFVGFSRVAEFDIDDEDFVIDSGDVADVMVMAEFKRAFAQGFAGTVTSYIEGVEVMAEVDSDEDGNSPLDIRADGADDLFADGSYTGDMHELRIEGIVVEATNANAASSAELVEQDLANDDYAEFTLELDVEAFEEDAYIDQQPVLSLTYEIVNAAGTVVADQDDAEVTAALDSSADIEGDSYLVDEGSSEEFVLTVTFEPARTQTTGVNNDDGDGSYRMRLTSVMFSDTEGGTTTTKMTTPASDYRTRSVQIVN